jgi:hypothetical protein
VRIKPSAIWVVLVGLLASLANSQGAHANTVFDLTSGTPGLYSGTITIDTVSGTIVSGDITASFQSTPFTFLSFADQSGNTIAIGFTDSATMPNDLFQLSLFDGGSLKNFSGAEPFDSALTGCGADGCTASAIGGDVGLLVAAVPEPSTWALMILGFLSLGFVAYWRETTFGPA